MADGAPRRKKRSDNSEKSYMQTWKAATLEKAWKEYRAKTGSCEAFPNVPSNAIAMWIPPASGSRTYHVFARTEGVDKKHVEECLRNAEFCVFYHLCSGEIRDQFFL